MTMPLYVLDREGKRQKFDSPFDDLFDKFPNLIEKAEVFHGIPKRTVGPVGLLYVCQREMGIISPEDDMVHFIGSDDATTCHIVIIRHESTGTVGLAHLDGVKTADAIQDMVAQIKALSEDAVTGYSAYIFGGFNDDRSLSLELSQEIIEALQSCSVEITLNTACMTHKNSIVRNGIVFPIIYGVAVEIQNGTVFPATFPDKGPNVPLRAARNSSVKSVLSIYNAKKRQIEIPPFDYEPLPYAEMWLSAPAHVILEHLSTSPQQEPDDFVTNVKNTIYFTMTTNREEVFKDGKDIVYKLTSASPGKWILQ